MRTTNSTSITDDTYTLSSPPTLHHSDIIPLDLPIALPSSSQLTLPDLQRCYRAHQILTKRVLRKAVITRTNNYTRAITRLFTQKPKLAIQLLHRRRNESQGAPRATLHSIRTTNGTLLSDPQEVIRTITEQATATLTPSPSVDPAAPFPWAANPMSRQPPPLPHLCSMDKLTITDITVDSDVCPRGRPQAQMSFPPK